MKKTTEAVCLSLVFLALALAVVSPALRFTNWWGVHDWVQFYTYYGVPHRAVTEFGELPAWNPYFYGGNVQWGHPDDPTLSPLFLLLLLFGVVPGTKVALVLVLAAGMYSMWLLARFLDLSRPASLFASVVWGLNGWHAYHFAVGHCDHLTFLLEPLAVYFFFRALHDRRWAVAVAAVLALMYLSGGPYPLVFSVILIAVLSLLLSGAHNSVRPMTIAFISFGFAVAFMALKLLATIDFMSIAETVPIDLTGSGFTVLWKALFDSSLPMHENYIYLGYENNYYGSWEYAAFIGYVPVVAFLAGAILVFRKMWPWITVAAIFLITSFGSASPVNFFSLFTAAPGLSGTHVPFRFIVHVIIAVSLVGGAGLDALAARLFAARKPLLKAASLLAVVCLSAANLVWMHYARPVPLYALVSYLLPPSRYGGVAPERPPFDPSVKNYNAYVPITYDEALRVYDHFLQSVRLPWGYDATRLRRFARFPDDAGYMGEAHLTRTEDGSARIVRASLSSYRVEYTASVPTTLTLNQNFAPGWRVNSSPHRVYAKDGLVAVDVPQGQGTLDFSYWPRTFLPGLILTAVGLVAAGVFLGRRPRPAAAPQRKTAVLPKT